VAKFSLTLDVVRAALVVWWARVETSMVMAVVFIEDE
jgi:hypothetical protein